MRNFMSISAFFLLILVTAGNSSICSGKDLPVCLSRADSIPRSRDGIITPDMAYMYVQEKLDGTCHAVYNHKLKIHYEEPYAVSSYQRLRFRIYDQHRNLLVGTDEAGGIDNASCADMVSPIIKTVENWLTIELLCPSLFEEYNYYYLEVWNGKGETSYLRFKCLPSIYKY